GRADRVLRRADRRGGRIPLVQLPPGGGLHGRRRLPRAGRLDRDAGRAHEGGAPVAADRRALRGRGGVGDPPGRELQADGAARLSHGAAPPPLRAFGLAGAEDRRALLDRLVRPGAPGLDDTQTEMTPPASGMNSDMRNGTGPHLVSGHPPLRRGPLTDWLRPLGPPPSLPQDRLRGRSPRSKGHPPTAPASRMSIQRSHAAPFSGHPPTVPASRISVP